MIEKIRLWWYMKVLRSAVSDYHYHKEHYEMWNNLKVTPDDSYHRMKRQYHKTKHLRGMESSVTYIRYNLGIPWGKWIDYGEGRQLMLVLRESTERQLVTRSRQEGEHIVKL